MTSSHLILITSLLLVQSVFPITTCPRQCICHEHSIACSCETSEKSELIISSLGSTYITSLVVHTCDKVTVLNGSFAGVVLVERLSFIAIERLYFEPYAFKDILQSPRQLVIDECKISSLAPVAFAGLSHIDHLWFRNSQIDVIAMEAFHYLTNIDYIYFHKTKIGRIERKAFSKMYQIDHFYFKDSIEIEMIESEAFSGSQIDELILDGVKIESAHDTFLINTDAEIAILKNCSIFLVPRKEEDKIEFDEDQKIIEKCLVESSTFNIMSPYKLGCNVLEVSSSNIQRIGPVSRDIDTPIFRAEPAISTSLNSISFSNCSIGFVDSYAFTNYTLSILSFNQSIIDTVKTNSIQKSNIKNLGFGASKIKNFNGLFIYKSIIKNLKLEELDIEDLNSEWISKSKIGNLRILNSKIEMIDRNLFKDSEFDEVEVNGNRVMIMDSEAFFGDNQITKLSITGNDLITTSPSPSILSSSPNSHPTSFILANNTIDCSPTDCSTNSFLLNSPKHSPLLYQISNNRCRPPIQTPCVDPRSISIEDHGITCRISNLIADCACTSSTSSIPLNFPTNISIVILGDCEHLTIDQRTAEFSQIYIFRTSKLLIKNLPSRLKILKIFHSTVSLIREGTAEATVPQTWEISNSKIDLIAPFGFSNLKLLSIHFNFCRLPHIPLISTRNSKIKNLIIENCFLESTQPLFEVSDTLKMQNSIIFSSPRGLGTIASAQLQNNTLLECCRHPFYSNPLGLDTIDLDPRCELHFYGSRCLDDHEEISKNHLPITSGSLIFNFSVYFALFFLFFLGNFGEIKFL